MHINRKGKTRKDTQNSDGPSIYKHKYTNVMSVQNSKGYFSASINLNIRYLQTTTPPPKHTHTHTTYPAPFRNTFVGVRVSPLQFFSPSPLRYNNSGKLHDVQNVPADALISNHCPLIRTGIQ